MATYFFLLPLELKLFTLKFMNYQEIWRGVAITCKEMNLFLSSLKKKLNLSFDPQRFISTDVIGACAVPFFHISPHNMHFNFYVHAGGGRNLEILHCRLRLQKIYYFKSKSSEEGWLPSHVVSVLTTIPGFTSGSVLGCDDLYV